MIKPIKANESFATRPTADELCKDMVQALHSASQPLTILRASLDGPDLSGKSAEEMRRLLKQSAQEVERLCLLFAYIQQFVVIGSTEADIEIENVPSLLAHTVEGVDLLFAEAGVGLMVKAIEHISPHIPLDSSRFEHALSTILLVALGLAGRGDVVILSSSVPGTTIEINILPALVTTMATQSRLSMALAAANLRSQGATLTWQEQPFTAQIALPSTKSSIFP